MIWKKAVLVLTAILAVILTVVAVRPSNNTEFQERVNLRMSTTGDIPFERSFAVKSFRIDGSWEGPGFAAVWLLGEGKRFLVFDTRAMSTPGELAAYGTPFENACIETCEMPPIVPKQVIAIISGPGVLSINGYRYSIPLEPSGLALCPTCQKISQPSIPDHALLVIVILLVIAIVGAHTLGHFCTNPTRKRLLVILFVGSFVVLAGVFGVSFAAPTTAVAATMRAAASVVSAVGVLSLFIMGGFEALEHKSGEQSHADVWKNLEEAEEQWEKRK